MKNIKYLLPFLLFACNTDISPELPQADAPVAIDAFIYHKAEDQVITVIRANQYFDRSTPEGVSNAQVTVVDLENDDVYFFAEDTPGSYVWTPESPTDSFGIIGNSYLMNVEFEGRTYNALSSINRVVPVDSITWRLEEEEPFSDGDYFVGEFWSTDAPGEGDAYWIKSWKNGVILNKPSEINIAIDGAFSEGDNADNITFIPPIRDAVSPFEFDDDDVLIDPFVIGDSLYVEINSLTREAHFFLQSVQIQTDREGGFGELFATPLANVPGNIFSSDPDEKVVGFFSMSASLGLGRVLTEEAIREVPE